MCQLVSVFQAYQLSIIARSSIRIAPVSIPQEELLTLPGTIIARLSIWGGVVSIPTPQEELLPFLLVSQ